MGSSRVTATALVAALVCAPAASSVAQPQGKPPNDAQMTQAKDLVNKAIAKSQSGDHQTAIELYLQAYNIAPLPLLLSNLGSEYQQANKPVEALKYFCKYLEAEPTGPNASYATSQAKVLQTQLHNPVDDAAVCKPPVVVTPAQGSGSGSAIAAGSAAGSAIVEPPPPPPEHDGGRSVRIAGIAMGAVGVASAVLGIVYGSKAASISDEITHHDPTTPWPDNIKDRENEGESDEHKQIAFLVVGGAAIAGGVVLYVIGHKKHASSERMALTPVAAPGYAGLSLTGGW